MPKQKLFDDESEEEVNIKTENEYAKKYDTWRGKEEIHKLEQKYGSNVLNSDPSISSDSEDESDEPSEESPEMETQFLKTLALLKKKDPRIYDPEFKFFNEKEKESVKESKEKTLTFADSDEDDDDDDDGNIFSIEKKAEVEQDLEKVKGSKVGQDGKLKDYLIGKVEHIDNTAEKDLEPLKALWSDPKINEGEAFLRDYILNKKYLEEGDLGEAEDRLRDDEELGADEQMVEEQDKFERAYNFRFEEPDQEYLKRFPRTMNYIRPKDERRSKKRAELRTRKEDERARKMDEIARLKALKLKEIQEKIARIKEVTGNEELGFKDEDIEGDFNPEEHDRRMRAIFDEQYYGDVDDEKPVFPDLDKELEIENWDDYEPEQEEKEAQDFSIDGPHCEDAEFNMDADFDPKSGRANLLEEMKRSLGKKRRSRKNKSKLAKLLSADKPKFIPEEEEKTYAEYMEEYYKMDCEDVIGGDLPTRFKYREVVPNDYGLTIEEILLADDRELTQWVPLKKLVRHKPESVQRTEVHAYAQRAADTTLKRKVLPSLFKNLPEEPELVVTPEENSTKKKKKKKSKKKETDKKEPDNIAVAESADEIEPNADDNSEQIIEADEVREVKVGKKKNKIKNTDVSKDMNISSSVENGDSSVEVVNDSKDVKSSQGVVKAKKNEKKEVKKNKTETVVTNVDAKVDKNEAAKSDLSKRQKKNLRKKLKKKEMKAINAKNATPSNNSLNNAAGKKRKISQNEQVPNKKQKQKMSENAQVVNKKQKDNGELNIKPNKNNENKPVEDRQKIKSPNKKEPPKNIKPNKADQNNKRDDKGAKNKDIKNTKFKNKNKQNNDRFKNKMKQIIDKSKSTDTDNPMNQLSDERLKAYGLNPKKYRGFLKYKKF